MIHTDAHNILQAIIAEPDDDLHRLAYADWCEENNQPERAEFIRLQIALWTEGGNYPHEIEAYDDLPTEARKRERYLWAKYSREWIGIGYSWHPLECLGSRIDQYARGFIRKVECAHHIWVDHGKKICAEHPIEDVRLIDKKPASYAGMYCYHSKNATFRHAEDACLHPEIHKHLAGFTQKVGNDSDWKDYPTEVDAQIAVAKACIAYGRSP